MKKHFITGLIILLPLALTLAIVLFIFNLLTEPFIGVVNDVLEHYGLLDHGIWFFSENQIQRYFSQILILFLLFFFTIGLGYLAEWFFIHYLIRFWEYLIQHIPFIGSVYRTCQDIIGTLFKQNANSFKQVVLVPFPSTQSYTIGLVTKKEIPAVGNLKQSLVAVFVPTTPNPTSGFLMLFQENDIVYLDIKVEDALKYIISCGVVTTPLIPVKKQES